MATEKERNKDRPQEGRKTRSGEDFSSLPDTSSYGGVAWQARQCAVEPTRVEIHQSPPSLFAVDEAAEGPTFEAELSRQEQIEQPPPVPQWKEIHVSVPVDDLNYISSVSTNVTEWIVQAIQEKRKAAQSVSSSQSLNPCSSRCPKCGQICVGGKHPGDPHSCVKGHSWK